jgi:cell division protein FtsB
VKALGLGFVLIALVATSALLDEETGVGIWLELRESLVVSDARIALLERKNEQLRREIEMFDSESSALDRVIREELDLALPGDVIVLFTGAPPGRSMPGP